jgi:hypothetical protein
MTAFIDVSPPPPTQAGGHGSVARGVGRELGATSWLATTTEIHLPQVTQPPLSRRP